jgi:hypothetical protein
MATLGDRPVAPPSEKYSQSILVLIITVAVFVLCSSAINFLAYLSVQQTADQIKSCTVTTGKCYKDSSRRTGGAVLSINKYTVASNLCADKYDGDAVILRCIEQKLKEQDNGAR